MEEAEKTEKERELSLSMAKETEENSALMAD